MHPPAGQEIGQESRQYSFLKYIMIVLQLAPNIALPIGLLDA
jgi:hypothetical protein